MSISLCDVDDNLMGKMGGHFAKFATDLWWLNQREKKCNLRCCWAVVEIAAVFWQYNQNINMNDDDLDDNNCTNSQTCMVNLCI